jgi:hypothetical protein
MVHEKKKSGDPDYDDKVPTGDHLTTVRAGDGTVIGRVDPALGPVTPEGSHLAIDVTAEDLDTRPAPGEVAEVKAEVQTYTAEDVPSESLTLDEVKNAESTNPDASGAVEMQEKSTKAAEAVTATQRENEANARLPRAQRTSTTKK